MYADLEKTGQTTGLADVLIAVIAIENIAVCTLSEIQSANRKFRRGAGLAPLIFFTSLG